jgi:DNA helicase II / ATP-dependent DNA helicase PcrA
MHWSSSQAFSSSRFLNRSRGVKNRSRPQRFFTHGQNAQGDRHVYASRTRFIPDGLLGLFERTAWPMAAPGPAIRPASEGVRIDVGARMRGMWR